MTIPDDSLGYFADEAIYFEQFDQLGPATSAFPFNTVEVYEADPGNAGFGYRDPLGASVVFEPTSTSGNDQVLRLVAQDVGGRHRHAGVQWLLPNTYFQAELRVRCAVDPDEVTSGVVLLWPWRDDDRYPPADNPEGPNPRGGEIDWWETFDDRDDRQPVRSFVHRLAPGAEPPYTQALDDIVVATLDHPEAQSDWHKIVCSWSPAGLWMEVDDGPRRVITTDINDIPSWPMVLTCQIDAWSDTPPSSPVNMDVDYVLFREWIPLYPFPVGDLDVQVEAAFGADRTASPLDWDWTNLTDRVRRQRFTAKRGRPSEAGQVTPGQVTSNLENLDGALTMGNPASPWYPHVERGTPIRYWVDGADPALVLPGIDGSTCSTPDHPDFTFVDSFDIRARIDPNMWAGPSTDLGAHQTIVRKGGSVGDRSFRCILDQAGRPELQPSTDGAGFSSITSSSSIDGRVAALRPRWVAWIYDADNTLDEGTYRSYTWEGHTDPPEDIADWTLVATSGDSSTFGPVFDSTAPVEIGTDNGTASFRGAVDRVEIRDGINGTLVADPDWTAAAPGASSITDSFSKEWTAAGDATVSTSRIRWSGNIDDLDVSWPIGDNQADANGIDQNPSECWTKTTAGGPLRFLQAGKEAPRSPIYRSTVSNNLAPAALWGYWPMETGDQAARAAAGIEGDTAMTLDGFTGTDDTLFGSQALPSISGGESCAWSAPVRDVSSFFAGALGCTFLFRAVSPDATYRRIMAIETEGTAARWEILYNSTGFRVRAVDGAEAQLFQTDESAPDPTYSGWYACYLRASQFASNTVWEFDAVPLQAITAATSDTGGSFAGTLGRPTNVGTSTTAADGAALSVGHVVVHDSEIAGWQLGWLNDAANAYTGETAAARFARLCEEDGIPVEVIGDPLSVEGGDLALSDVMGPQQSAPLVDLLRQVAALDGGYLIERPSAAGLIYRTRIDVESQTLQALPLTGQAEGFRPGLGFTNDDARYRNQWTVTSIKGSSAIASDPTEIEARGLVDDSVEVNSVGGVNVGIAGITRPAIVPLVDTALDTIAQRRLGASTVVDPRVRRVQTELAIAPHLIERWHNLAPGDRVTLDGLPAQWTDGPVDLIAEGFTEHWEPDSWATSLACAPAATYLEPLEYAAASGTVTLVGNDDDLQAAIDAAAPGDRIVFSGDHTNEGQISLPQTVYLTGSSSTTSKVERLLTSAPIDSLWLRRFTIERVTPVDSNLYVGLDTAGGPVTNFVFSDLTVTGHGLNIGIGLDRRWDNDTGVIHNCTAYEIENRGFELNCDNLRTWGLVAHDIYRTVDLPFLDVDAVNLVGANQRHSGFWFYNINELDSISSISPGRANPTGPNGTADTPHPDGFQSFRTERDDGSPWLTDNLIIEDGVINLQDGGRQAIILESNSSAGAHVVSNVVIRRVLMSGTDGQLVNIKGVSGLQFERNVAWITRPSSETFRVIRFAAGGNGGAATNPGVSLITNWVYAADGQPLLGGTPPAGIVRRNSIELAGQPRHASRFFDPIIERPTDQQIAEWLASATPPPDPDPDPTPLTVVGSDDVANVGGGIQTLTNPIVGTGGTLLYGVAAPGPGEEALDAGYIFPPGAIEIRDYPGASFVPRLRLAAGPEPGTATIDLGWDSAADTQSCFVVGLSGLATAVVASAVSVDVATASSYSSIPTEVDDQVITVAVGQQNDEMTAGPTPTGTGPGEFTELIQTTDDVTVRGLAVHHGPAAAGATAAPGSATWDNSTSAKVRVTVGFRGSGVSPTFAPLPAADWTVYVDADDPDSFNQNRPDGQLIVAGNVLQQGATADTQSGAGYGFAWGAVAPNEIHSTFPTEAPDNDTKRLGVEPAPPGLLNTTGAMVTKHVFRNDSNYVFQSGGQNTSTTYPGTDRLFFDGTRTQLALIPTSATDPKAIRASFGGATGDRVLQSSLFLIEPWMRSTELAAAGGAIHAKGGAQSPWTQFLGQSQLRIITRDMPSQPWDTGGGANPYTSTDRHIEPIGAADVGDWWGVIYDYRIDPIDGHLHAYLNKAGTGWVQTVNVNAGWGLSYADANPDQDLWHAFLLHSYWFHNATPPPINNWAATDIVDGAAIGNNRFMWYRFGGIIVAPGAITAARLQSHGSYFLGG